MKMKVTAEVIKGSDGRYSCYVPVEFDNFGLAGYGDTAEEAKRDMLEAYEQVKEINSEAGISTPELAFSFKYDLQSFFNCFPFLNVSKIADMAGINQSQMRQYTSGHSAASEKQYAKVRSVMERIRSDFNQAVL